MAVVYEQDIEFNGTKLTVNPQFNETEVTRCKVNDTDVIHKFVGEQVALDFSASAAYITDSEVTCGVTDNYLDQLGINLTLTPRIATWDSENPHPTSITLTNIVVKERVPKAFTSSPSDDSYLILKQWNVGSRTINMNTTTTLVNDSQKLSLNTSLNNQDNWPNYGFLVITANATIGDKSYTLSINEYYKIPAITNPFTGTVEAWLEGYTDSSISGRPEGLEGFIWNPEDQRRSVSWTHTSLLGEAIQEY